MEYKIWDMRVILLPRHQFQRQQIENDVFLFIGGKFCIDLYDE